MLRRSVWSAVLVIAALAAPPVEAGFTGTDVFLPAVGSAPGVSPSVWYTTVWVTNTDTVPADITFYLLERQPNLAPPTFHDTVPPGDIRRYDDVVTSLFGVETFGALRITSNVRISVGSRVFSQPGADAEMSQGQFFAAVPASFALGVGETTAVGGVWQIQPEATSDFRYNFGFVETTGAGSCSVMVEVFAADGTKLAARAYPVGAWQQVQRAFRDEFPNVSTDNARLELTVLSGAGRVIAFGSQVANGSQDPTTFEMLFADHLLAENGSGGAITGITAGEGLTGGGSSGPVALHVGAGPGIAVESTAVSIAPGGVSTDRLADGAVTSAKLGDGTVTSGKLAVANAPADGDSLVFTPAGLSWQAPTSVEGGDITGVTAGAGLTGGASEGEATLAIATDGVTAAMIGDAAVGSSEIADGAVAGAELARAAVGTDKIAPSAVTSAELAAAAVTTAHLADDAVTAAKVADRAIRGGHLANDAVTSAKIKDGSVNNADLGDGVVTQTKLEAGFGKAGQVLATTGSRLQWADASSGDITEVAAGAGLTGGGEEGAVTLEIGAGRVTSEMIHDGAIADADVAFDYAGSSSKGGPAVDVDCPGCVAGKDLADGSVSQAKLAVAGGGSGQVLSTDGASLVWNDASSGDITGVTAGPGLDGGGDTGEVSVGIATGGVDKPMLATNSVTSAKILDGTIDANDLAGSAVTKAKLAAAGGTSGQVLATDGLQLVWTDASGDGDITGVTAGAGLDGGGASGEVTLSVAASGITSTMVLDGNLTSDDIGFNYAGSASKGGPADDLACTNCVAAAEIDPSGGSSGKVLKHTGTTVQWADDEAGGLVLPYDEGANVLGAVFKVSNGSASSGDPETGIGIHGVGRPDGIGVKGYSFAGVGVFGIAGQLGEAVRGIGALNDTHGVLGGPHSGAYGRYGDAPGNYGMLGTSSSGASGENVNGNWGALGREDEGVDGFAALASAAAVHGEHTAGPEGFLGTQAAGVEGVNTVGNSGYLAYAGMYGVFGEWNQGGEQHFGALGMSSAGALAKTSDDTPGLKAESGTGSAVRAVSGGAGTEDATVHSKATAHDGIAVYAWSEDGHGLHARSDRGGIPGAAVHAESTSGSGIAINANNNSTDATIVGGNSGAGDLLKLFNGNNLRLKVDNDGDLSIDGSYHSGGADFAEMLPARDQDLEPGDVLAISADGRLMRSIEAYQASVVGVYSTKPGMVGGSPIDGVGEDLVPLAVVGVVPVKACSEGGPIRPGDMLVASSTPGHAMRAGKNPPIGRVIGKALSALEDGWGMVTLLVILQ